MHVASQAPRAPASRSRQSYAQTRLKHTARDGEHLLQKLQYNTVDEREAFPSPHPLLPLLPLAHCCPSLDASERHGRDERRRHFPNSSHALRIVRNLFSVPPPVKRLFDKVPLLTYPPNPLPQRAPKASRIPSLYVFSNDGDAAAGRPSFNPTCLKWQVSAGLRINRVTCLTRLNCRPFSILQALITGWLPLITMLPRRGLCRSSFLLHTRQPQLRSHSSP
jgi:hypothetical protein